MEAIFIVFSFIITMVLPILTIVIVYIGFFALIIWFIISFMKTQKERNQILKDISKKLDEDKELHETSNSIDHNPLHAEVEQQEETQSNVEEDEEHSDLGEASPDERGEVVQTEDSEIEESQNENDEKMS